MDDNVLKAMQRWPDVPAAFGWLRLDRRGRWYLIDRNAPGFDETEHGQGSLITSEQIIEFISRNYAGDDQGRWYWQNGPQKAYADLELAPLILRVITTDGRPALVTHTGHPVTEVSAAYASNEGSLFAQTNLGPAAIHDMDLAALDLQEDQVTLLGQRFDLQTLNAPAPQALNFNPKPR